MKNVNLLFLIAVIAIFSSCMPTKVFVDTSCPGYRNTEFKRTDITSKGIGIMPVLGGEEKEQFRRPMGDAITKYFRIEFGDDKVKSTNEVIKTINDNNLSDSYSKALTDYRNSGIVPKELVIQLGNALGLDYLLYTRMLSDAEITTVIAGNSVQLIRIDEIYVQCQIWDTKIGDIVWEGKGGVAKTVNSDCNVIETTALGLSKIVGNDINKGPCEKKQDLIKSQQDALTNTYLATLGISTILSLLLLLAI